MDNPPWLLCFGPSVGGSFSELYFCTMQMTTSTAKLLEKGTYYFGESALEVFAGFLAATRAEISKVFVICDNNTFLHCLPVLEKHVDCIDGVITIDAGEQAKVHTTLTRIWEVLLQSGADRNSLVLNLGGGMVTDIGGFAASTYMRGIRFVHLPTTLLAMVDASIGGKTGIDFSHVKNIVGSFAFPELIIADPGFLNTLSIEELKNGYAEMIKHQLIADPQAWEDSCTFAASQPDNEKWKSYFLTQIESAAAVKLKIVGADPTEKGLRAALNFGHTIGHAIEGYKLSQGDQALPHGAAVAAGMICESWLAVKLCKLDASVHQDIVSVLDHLFPRINLHQEELEAIVQFAGSDKKNLNSEIRCSLISAPGVFALSIPCEQELLKSALTAYMA